MLKVKKGYKLKRGYKLSRKGREAIVKGQKNRKKYPVNKLKHYA